MGWRSIWLAPLFFVIGFDAFAHNTMAVPFPLDSQFDCESYFSPSEKIQLSRLLAKVPSLQSYIVEMSNDPEVPVYVKKLLKRSLLNTDIEIIELTADLRKEFEIPDQWGAYANHKKPPRGWNYPRAVPASEILGASKTKTDRTFAVITPDSDDFRALVTLIHELAHIRFATFLEKNYAKICRRFPSSFAQYINGECRLHVEFIRWLHEKFAYETEWRILGKVFPLYFPNELSASDAEIALKSPQQRAPDIGKDLLATPSYGFTTPQFAMLWDRPVSKILLAGDRIDAIDEAVKLVVKNPAIEKPGVRDFRLAMTIIVFLREARGFAKVKQITFAKLAEYLGKLIDAEKDGKERAEHLLAATLHYADQHPETKPMLTAILRAPDVARQLQRLDWPPTR